MDKKSFIKKISQFIVYLLVSYGLYLIMDTLSRYFSDHTKYVQYMWNKKNWMSFLFLWHGFIFILAYAALKNRSMKTIVISGIIFGVLLEAFVYQKTKIINLFAYSPIFYALLFYLPFKLIRKIPLLSKK